MESTKKIAQFSVPGGESGSIPLEAPSGIPRALQGGLENSGTAFFQTIVNNLIILGSFLALVMVIVSGIQWMTSGGNPEKIGAAKRRFFYSIIGLIIMLSAFFIVRLVVVAAGGSFEDFLNPTNLLNDCPTC